MCGLLEVSLRELYTCIVQLCRKQGPHSSLGGPNVSEKERWSENKSPLGPAPFYLTGTAV